MRLQKADILAVAQRLFAAQGYHRVSMRAIAGELGISVGNLTYHYPRKQDLATALLEQELETIIVPAAPGLAVLDDYLRRMLYSLLEHARIFSDPLIFQDMPAQQQENSRRIRRLRENLLAMLQAQEQAGLFVPLTPAQRQDLTQMLMYSHVGWQQQVIQQRTQPAAAVQAMMCAQWTVLLPFLTPQGRAQQQALYPQ